VPIRGISSRLVPRNPAGEASEGRDQSAGYTRRRHLHAIADVGSIPTVSTPARKHRALQAKQYAATLHYRVRVAPRGQRSSIARVLREEEQ
jgi:hypothetical protein